MTKLPRLLVFALALSAVAAGALIGGFGSDQPRASAPAAAVTDVGALLAALSTGDSEAVVSRLEREAADRPRDARVQAVLGLGYQQLFRETSVPAWLSRSRAAFERALALGGRRDPDTLAGLAQLSATQHRFREAARHARGALRLAPGHPAALGALADALVELGRYDEAFAVIDRKAAQGPSVAAYARVARARELLGRPTAALEAMELALEAGSGIPEQRAWVLTRLAELQLAHGRVQSARDGFRRSLAIQPGFPHAVAGLARTDLAAGDAGAAIARLEKLLARVPSAEYAVELGDAYLLDGRARAADEAYERARAFQQELSRNGVRTMLASAALDLDRGLRLSSALARARQAHREAPNIETQAVLAWALERNGRCGEARSLSSRALSLGTQDATLYFQRGMIERCLGEREAAAGWFRKALETDPAFSVRWAPVAARLAG